MIEFVIGLCTGVIATLMAIHESRKERAFAAGPAQPAIARLSESDDDELEEYEDPGKTEREAELEMYRRLLQEEFGADMLTGDHNGKL